MVKGIVAGLTSKEIARQLNAISPRTVDKHRENAMKKLAARNPGELMQRLYDST